LAQLSSISFFFPFMISFATTLCQRHEEPQEQRLKEMSKSNVQTGNKTRLCDSKIKTQELKIRP
jgi:hypothetical protein